MKTKISCVAIFALFALLINGCVSVSSFRQRPGIGGVLSPVALFTTIDSPEVTAKMNVIMSETCNGPNYKIIESGNVEVGSKTNVSVDSSGGDVFIGDGVILKQKATQSVSSSSPLKHFCAT